MHGEISMRLHAKFIRVANLDDVVGKRTSVLILFNPLKLDFIYELIA